MVSSVAQALRWLWEAVILPNVILALAALVTDGMEAWSEFGRSVTVLFFFLRGRSHRNFPLSRSQSVKNKIVNSRGTEGGSGRGRKYGNDETVSGSSSGEDDEDAAIDAESSSEPCRAAAAAAVARQPLLAGGSSSNSMMGEALPMHVLIHRRILMGRRGERHEWMEEVPGHVLVPHSTSLSYSQSLHQLVSCVIGPIQQATVSTLPGRHLAPQWPPHYVRSSKGSSAASRRTAAGEGYASSSSALARGSSRAVDFGESNSSATESFSVTSANRRPQYRQAANVVYRRVSSRHIELRQSRPSVHPIASITAHHVLSYQATRQKVLVMDLDETLCHVSTSTANMQGPPTFSEVIPTASGAELFHVWVRPYAQLFLTTMAKLFNLALFTSASKPYADTILRRIDPNGLIKERYYRQDCRVVPRGTLANTVKRQSGSPNNNSLTGASTGRDDASRLTSEWSDAAAGIHSSGGRGDGGGGCDTDGSASASTTTATAQVTSGSNSPPSEAVASTPLGGAPTSSNIIPSDGHKPVLNENAKVLVKDLRTLKVPPELIIMIDNSEECTLLNRENAIIITPYIPSTEHRKKSSYHKNGEADDAEDLEEVDEVLLGLIACLEPLLVVPDVRSILRHGKVY